MLKRSLVLVGTALLVVGCGDERPRPVERTDAAPDRIALTTDDGSVVEFGDFRLECPDTNNWWGQDADVVQAVAGSYGEGGRSDGLMFTARAGFSGRVKLPHSEEWGHYETFVLAFAPRASKATELSSAVEEASGEIEIISASCDPEPRMELTIDAVLFSETNAGSGTVKGHLALK